MSKDFLGKLDLAKFINNVEKQANEGAPNGKIDTAKEKSIFGEELNKYAQANNLSDEDVNQIWGLALSDKANVPATKAAGGPDIIINVGNEYNFTININVQNDFEKVINDFLNGGGIENIINMLIKHMGDLGDNILNALVQILNDKFGDKFDFDGLTDLLNQIIDRLDKQNEQIGDLNGKIDDLQNQLVFYAEQNLKALNVLGLNMEELINQVKTSNEKQDKQYELMNKMYEAILELTEKCGNLSIDLQDFTTLITNAIKNGNVKMDEIIELLKGIKEDTSQNKEISNNILQAVTKFGEEGIQLGKEILDAIKNMGNNGPEFTQQMLALLNDSNTKLDDIKELLALIKADTSENNKTSKEILEVVKGINTAVDKLGADTSEVLTKILNATVKNGGDLADIKELLALIKADTSENNKTSKEILEVVKEINTAVGKLGADTSEVLTKILNATVKNGGDLADIKELLKAIKTDTAESKELSKKILEAVKKLGAENTSNFTAILNAINNIKVGGGDNTQLEALLKKVLDRMDENTAKIIEAMANIKVEAGTVDLSGIEKMLAELLKLTENNGYLLEDIDGKLETINVTIDAAKDEILAKMDKNNQALVNIANKIAAKLDNLKNSIDGNSQEILKQLTTINTIIANLKPEVYDDTALMQKLDDILSAIQDHKVVVDVTGKVTCECNCGNSGSHEGILDDLNSIMSVKNQGTTGIDDVNANQADRGAKKVMFKSGNPYGLPAGTYIMNGKDIYDMSGRKVAEANN